MNKERTTMIRFIHSFEPKILRTRIPSYHVAPDEDVDEAGVAFSDETFETNGSASKDRRHLNIVWSSR